MNTTTISSPRKPPVPPEDRLSARSREAARARSVAFIEAGTLPLRIAAFAALGRWIWGAGRDRTFAVHLARWTQLLEEDAALRLAMQTAFADTLAHMQSVSLLSETGLPTQHALLQEGMRRVLQRLLPSVRAESDTMRLLLLLLPSQRDVFRFTHLPEAQFAQMLHLLWPGTDARAGQKLTREAEEALRLLATRTGSRGISSAMRERGSGGTLEQSPFYQIIRATDALIAALPTNDAVAEYKRWNAVVRECREELDQVHLHMEGAGVSSALVFDIRTVDLALTRMCRVAATLVAAPGPLPGVEMHNAVPPASSILPEKAESIQQLLNGLAVAQLRDTRLSSLLRENLNLLARKTVERTGHGGEHYIAHSRSEYWLMWRAAMGGGLLTVFTAAIKMRIAASGFPPFIEGLLSGTNYAVSFILLQVFGLVLATKQPSMTAATFAGIVRRNRGYARWSKIADFVAAITRSQLAAALGNILAVVIGAIAFERLWWRVFRSSYLPISSAQRVYQTLHPFTSGTAFFAIVTGVILWLAALIGGWFENFAVYHHLTEAVRQHPFGRRVGQARMRKVGDVLERDLAGWSTSIALGYLLGFTPVISSFFGVKIDVRHVTLTTGTLALAASRYGTKWFGRGWLYWAIAGIGVTFVLNLTVSFSIAAYVALRAYDVPRSEQWELVKFLAKEVLRSPLKFVAPVGEGGGSERIAAELMQEE